MTSVLYAFLAAAVRGALPYPDLVRRWRVRRAVRSLVVCEPWPADSAITSNDVAQLVLLRLLWLQKQTRRAVRGRHREAAVLLARSSLEACILGLYCLHSPDAVDRLRAAHFKSSGRLLAFLDAAGIFPQTLIKQAIDAFGTSSAGPDVMTMATRVDTETGGSVVVDLYNRFYAPTSAYFVHANASSLLRHVKVSNGLASRPSVPWARRSPARLADACVGLLAGAIAHRSAKPNDLFARYAEAHLARTMTPLIVMVGKGMGRYVKIGQLVDIIRAAVELRRYLSGPARNDPAQLRESRVRLLFDKMPLDPEIPPEAFRPVVDYLVVKVLGEWESVADSSAAV